MGIQIIGTKNCRETQKTERYFKERGIGYHFVDLKQRNLSHGELESIVRSIGAEALINKDSKIYKKRGMSYMDYDPVEELEEYPELVKTPIVREGSRAVLGFDPDLWNEIIGEKNE